METKTWSGAFHYPRKKNQEQTTVEKNKPSPIPPSPVVRPVAESPINIYWLFKQFSSIHLLYCSLCFFKFLILNQCITLKVNYPSSYHK